MENSTCESCTFSLPKFQVEWIEDKKKKHPQKAASKWVQEGLDFLIKKERTHSYDKLAFIFLFLLIGGTLAIFTFMLIPTLSVMFYVFLAISFISLIGGYLGIYIFYKEKKTRWIS